MAASLGMQRSHMVKHLSRWPARQWFEETTGLSVETAGVIVHEQEKWPGASLDGIIDKDTILEIKCPTDKKLEARNGSLMQLIDSNKYVRIINRQYVLRETASGLGFYYQLQLAMHCANKLIASLLSGHQMKNIFQMSHTTRNGLQKRSVTCRVHILGICCQPYLQG